MVRFPQMVKITLQFDSRETEFPVPVKLDDADQYSCNAYLSTDKDWNIQYTLYYLTNQAIGVFGQCFPMSTWFGYHEHDIERITVYSSGYIHLSAHGHTQGTWTSLSNLEVDPLEKSYIVYVAKGSHAMYPRKGTVWRGFGFANDICDGKGKRVHLSVRTSKPSYDYRIAKGFDLTKAIQYPYTDLITPVQRFLLPMSL